MIRVFIVLAVAALAAASCSVVVPAELPAFSCMVHGVSVCGGGEFCNASAACEVCFASEIACDGLDEDCNGAADDGNLCGGLACVSGRCEDPTDGGAPPSDGAVVPVDSAAPPDVYVCSVANCPAPGACDEKTNSCVRGGSVALGGACTASSVCATGVCSDAGAFPASWLTAGRFCTQVCCASSECPAGAICAATGTGGRYCVQASRLAVPALGTKAVGESCSAPSACRSGRCEASICVDVCCTDSNCPGALRCGTSSVSLGGTQGEGLHCRSVSSGPAKAPNATCTSAGQCASGICRRVSSGILDPSFCMAPCCASAACGTTISLLAITQLRCGYERPEGASVVVTSCREAANGSGKQVGQACALDSDCFSNQCDSVIGKCTDVCCTNDDCARLAAGWRCVPSFHLSPNAPRCQPPS